MLFRGPVAQLGEYCIRIAGVVSSTLIRSTTAPDRKKAERGVLITKKMLYRIFLYSILLFKLLPRTL